MVAEGGHPVNRGLTQFDRKGETSSVAAETARRSTKAPSREGTVQIAAFFPEEVWAQLKVLAAEQRRDMQDLLAEALNLIFVQYGKAEIAPRKAPD